MKQQIKLSESELRNLITATINESMDENWWNRNMRFNPGKRGNAQLQDAQAKIKQSDAKIMQFMQSAQSGASSAGGVNVQNQGGNHAWMPQNTGNAAANTNMNEETGHLVGATIGAGVGGGIGGPGGALIGAGLGAAAAGVINYFSVNNDFKTLTEAFQLRADAYNFIARAASNGIDVSQISDTLLHIGPEVNGGQQTQPDPAQGGNGQYATTWQQAEQEINQVVNGNFQNWPAKCKQAGWPDDKIAAYRKLANDSSQNPNGVKNWNRYVNGQNGNQQQPANGQQQPATQQPANGQQQPANNQQQVSEAVNNVIRKLKNAKRY